MPSRHPFVLLAATLVAGCSASAAPGGDAGEASYREIVDCGGRLGVAMELGAAAAAADPAARRERELIAASLAGMAMGAGRVLGRTREQVTRDLDGTLSNQRGRGLGLIAPELKACADSLGVHA